MPEPELKLDVGAGAEHFFNKSFETGSNSERLTYTTKIMTIIYRQEHIRFRNLEIEKIKSSPNQKYKFPS
jgi:hypothetical protein